MSPIAKTNRNNTGNENGSSSCRECSVNFNNLNLKKRCLDCTHSDYLEWKWDTAVANPKAIFKKEERQVLFNPGFSVGTVGVRGAAALKRGLHHFFEIEMSTEVYGTDMMIGVGTDKTNLNKFSTTFVSLLGLDEESWGLSYSGDIHHNGFSKPYTRPFGEGTRVGVHLDLWLGTLEFYINKKPLGVAFTNLKNKDLYPMICSTAARSGMSLTFAQSFQPSLQLSALLSLGRIGVSNSHKSVLRAFEMPPGLRGRLETSFWWVSIREERGGGRNSMRQGMRRKNENEENEGSGGGDLVTELRNMPESKRLRLRSTNGN